MFDFVALARRIVPGVPGVELVLIILYRQTGISRVRGVPGGVRVSRARHFQKNEGILAGIPTNRNDIPKTF